MGGIEIGARRTWTELCKVCNSLSATGTRTRVARVRAEYPNQLDYSGLAVYSGVQANPFCQFVNEKHSASKRYAKLVVSRGTILQSVEEIGIQRVAESAWLCIL